MRLLRRRVGHRSHHHGVKTPPRLGPDYAALHRTASPPPPSCAAPMHMVARVGAHRLPAFQAGTPNALLPASAAVAFALICSQQNTMCACQVRSSPPVRRHRLQC